MACGRSGMKDFLIRVLAANGRCIATMSFTATPEEARQRIKSIKGMPFRWQVYCCGTRISDAELGLGGDDI